MTFFETQSTKTVFSWRNWAIRSTIKDTLGWLDSTSLIILPFTLYVL